MTSSQNLPSDLQACHALIQQQSALQEETSEINQSLASELEKIKHELEQLKRYIYGRRSERHVEDDSQLTLFDQELQSDSESESSDEEDLEEEITYRRRKRKKSDRFPQNIPREVQTIDVPEEERICPCCGDEMPVIDEDVRERLEYIPAKMLVHELHYLKRLAARARRR